MSIVNLQYPIQAGPELTIRWESISGNKGYRLIGTDHRHAFRLTAQSKWECACGTWYQSGHLPAHLQNNFVCRHGTLPLEACEECRTRLETGHRPETKPALDQTVADLQRDFAKRYAELEERRCNEIEELRQRHAKRTGELHDTIAKLKEDNERLQKLAFECSLAAGQQDLERKMKPYVDGEQRSKALFTLSDPLSRQYGGWSADSQGR